MLPGKDGFFVCLYCSCVWVFHLHVCLYTTHMHAWCPWRPEKGVGSLGTRVSDDCVPGECWELNPAPPEEQPGLLAVKPSLQTVCF